MQVRYYLFVLSLFLTLSGNSFAQEKNYLGLSLGLSDFHIRDDHASPLFFSGIGFNPTAQFLYKSELEIHSVELSYFYDYQGSLQLNFNTNNWRGKAKYSYLHSINDFIILDNQLRIFVGGSVSSYFSLSDYRYIDDNLAITSWYWNHSLNAELGLLYALSQKGYISAKLSIPVLSNISRPDYSPSENYNYETNSYEVEVFGRMETIPNNFFINTMLTFNTPISDRFSLQIDYEFFYAFYKKPKEVNMFMNNIKVGLFLTF